MQAPKITYETAAQYRKKYEFTPQWDRRVAIEWGDARRVSILNEKPNDIVLLECDGQYILYYNKRTKEYCAGCQHVRYEHIPWLMQKFVNSTDDINNPYEFERVIRTTLFYLAVEAHHRTLKRKRNG